MKRVKNELLKKEFKKINNSLIIALVFLAMMAICLVLMWYSGESSKKNSTNMSEVASKYYADELIYFNEIIENKEITEKEGIKAKLLVASKPILITKDKENEDYAYYLVYDGKYDYIAYMSGKDYDKLSKLSEVEFVAGTSKIIDKELRATALKVYNSNYKKKILDKDFESYLGGVYFDLSESISLKEIEEEKASVTIKEKPVKLFKDKKDAKMTYYGVLDGDNAYIIKINDNDYAKINENTLEDTPETVYGVAKKIDFDLLNSMGSNENVTPEFFTVLGGVYLEVTNNDTMFTILVVVDAISGLCFFSFMVAYLIRRRQINSGLKKLSDEELEKIEKEIDDKETFYYERAHLILTKHYIISMIGKFTVEEFKNIIWIYEFRLKQYGITANKSLMAMNNKGEVRALVQVDGVTKKSTAVLNEIAETMVSKNENILVGYTKENRDKTSEFLKELKKEKKEQKRKAKEDK